MWGAEIEVGDGNDGFEEPVEFRGNNGVDG